MAITHRQLLAHLLTLSKAVEHARGWVATKMGLVDMSTVSEEVGHDTKAG